MLVPILLTSRCRAYEVHLAYEKTDLHRVREIGSWSM
jgi:hypothetical protein